MSDPYPTPNPNPVPPGPPPPFPPPKPVREPDPDRLPDEDPLPNPDEQDAPPKQAAKPKRRNIAPSGRLKRKSASASPFAKGLKMTDKKRQVDRMATSQTEDYLRRSSLTYLECCIGVMLTHMSREQAAEILEAEARFVRELE